MAEQKLSKRLSTLKERYGIRSFKFVDDNFLGGDFENRAQKIHDNLSKLGIEYRCYLRVDQITNQVADLIKKSGCRHIAFGIESGDDSILKSMKRGYKIQDIINGINLVHDTGMIVRLCFMVGFPPLESDKTINNTIKLLDRLRFQEYFVYPFLPYPRCDVAENPSNYGVTWINKDYSKYVQIGKGKSSGYVFTTKTYGPSEIIAWQKRLMDALEKKSCWFGESKIGLRV